MIGSRPKPGGDNNQEANSGASSQGRNPVRTVAVHRRLLGENVAPSKRVFAPTASYQPASLFRNDAAHNVWSGATGASSSTRSRRWAPARSGRSTSTTSMRSTSSERAPPACMRCCSTTTATGATLTASERRTLPRWPAGSSRRRRLRERLEEAPDPARDLSRAASAIAHCRPSDRPADDAFRLLQLVTEPRVARGVTWRRAARRGEARSGRSSRARRAHPGGGRAPSPAGRRTPSGDRRAGATAAQTGVARQPCAR